MENTTSLEESEAPNCQQIYEEGVKKIKKKYSTLCDRAKKLIGEDLNFSYCKNPYTNGNGKVTCNGKSIGAVNKKKIYFCDDLNSVFTLRYYEERELKGKK